LNFLGVIIGVPVEPPKISRSGPACS
jgi:hypothetical protein